MKPISEAYNMDCMEIFKPSKDNENYLVSNKGRVYTINNKKLLKPQNASNGYLYVTINRHSVPIHRLVATCFLDNKANLPCINHKDGNKHNNSVDNLEWCTFSENLIHAYTNKLNKRPKPIIQMKNGIVINRYESARSAELYGFSNQLIAKCCKGKRKHHKGYEWKYE